MCSVMAARKTAGLHPWQRKKLSVACIVLVVSKRTVWQICARLQTMQVSSHCDALLVCIPSAQGALTGLQRAESCSAELTIERHLWLTHQHHKGHPACGPGARICDVPQDDKLFLSAPHRPSGSD